MCWNADVSLNTFLFSCLALGFVYYTNTYTQYKTPLFDNPIAYVAFMSFVGIQLVEYFLWRNLKSREWNRVFSTIGLGLLYLQPFLFLLLTTNQAIKTILLYVYAGYIAIQLLGFYYMGSISPYITVKNQHLRWYIHEKMESYPTTVNIVFLSNILWLSIYAYSVYQIAEYLFLAFGISTILLSIIIHKQDWGSMWCWMANTYMIWLVFRILIVLPYYEYSGLC